MDHHILIILTGLEDVENLFFKDVAFERENDTPSFLEVILLRIFFTTRFIITEIHA